MISGNPKHFKSRLLFFWFPNFEWFRAKTVPDILAIKNWIFVWILDTIKKLYYLALKIKFFPDVLASKIWTVDQILDDIWNVSYLALDGFIFRRF